MPVTLPTFEEIQRRKFAEIQEQNRLNQMRKTISETFGDNAIANQFNLKEEQQNPVRDKNFGIKLPITNGLANQNFNEIGEEKTDDWYSNLIKNNQEGNIDLRKPETFASAVKLPEIYSGMPTSKAPLPEAKTPEMNTGTYLGLNAMGGFISGTTASPYGVDNMVRDISSGGEFGKNINKLNKYLLENENELNSLMFGSGYDEDRAVRKIAASANVGEDVVRTFKKNNYAKNLKEFSDKWVDETGRNPALKYVGSTVYTIANQIPNWMVGIGMGGVGSNPSLVSTVRDSVKNAITSGTGAKGIIKASVVGLGKGILNASKGNATTWLMGLGSAGSKFFENQLEYGDDNYNVVGNFFNSALTGYADEFTESIGGFTDIPSIEKFLGETSGSTFSSVSRALLSWFISSAEEGLEEVINVPLTGLADKLFLDHDKKMVGDGGVFDFKEMARSGIDGFVVGGLMGAVSTVATVANITAKADQAKTQNPVSSFVYADTMSSEDIRNAAEMLNNVSKDFDISTLNPKTATTKDVENKSAEVLNAIKKEYDSILDGGKSKIDEKFNPITKSGRENNASQESINTAKNINAATSVSIRFYSTNLKNGIMENGYYKNGTIFVNANSENTTAQIISHELTHSIENTNEYKELRSMIVNKMVQDGTYEKEVSKKRALYHEGGIELQTQDDIMREITAEYVEKNLLTDENSITSLVNQNRTLGQRIKGWLDTILAKMGNKEAKERAFVSKARDLYAAALGEPVNRGEIAEFSVTKENNEDEYKVQSPKVRKYKEGRRTLSTGIYNIEDRIRDAGTLSKIREQARAYARNENGTVDTDKYYAKRNELINAELENKVRENIKKRYETKIKEYMNDGLSEDQAIDKVFSEQFNQQELRGDETPQELYDIYFDQLHFEDTDIEKLNEFSEKENETIDYADDTYVPPERVKYEPKAKKTSEIKSDDNLTIPKINEFEEKKMQELKEFMDEANEKGYLPMRMYKEIESDPKVQEMERELDRKQNEVDKILEKHKKIAKERAEKRYKELFTSERKDEVSLEGIQAEEWKKEYEAVRNEILKKDYEAEYQNLVNSGMSEKEAIESVRGKLYKSSKSFADAESKLKQSGYRIEGAVTEGYHNAKQILLSNEIDVELGKLIKKFKKQFDVNPAMEDMAKLLVMRKISEDSLPYQGYEKERIVRLAELMNEQNSARMEGSKSIRRMQIEELAIGYDAIFSSFDWAHADTAFEKLLRSRALLNVQSLDDLAYSMFGDTETSKEIQETVFDPIIENSARAERMSNAQIAELKALKLTNTESKAVQLFLEYGEGIEAFSSVDRDSIFMDLISGKMSTKDFTETIVKSLKKGESVANEDLFTKKTIGEMSRAELAKEKTRREQLSDTERGYLDIKDAADEIVSQAVLDAAKLAKNDYVKEHGKGSWNRLDDQTRTRLKTEAQERIAKEKVSKIKNGGNVVRDMYNQFYENINEMLITHGMKPLNFRKNYMPHRQPDDIQTEIDKIMASAGLDEVYDLPASISGMTKDFRPYSKWNTFMQKRRGNRTIYDAVGNAQRYILAMNQTLFHVDDILKVRTLETYIRKRYSEDRKEYLSDLVREVESMGMNAKEAKEQLSEDNTKFSNVTSHLRILGNELAGKQNFTRDIEDGLGRRFLNFTGAILNKSNQTLLKFNLSSALKQTSQLSTVWAECGINHFNEALKAAIPAFGTMKNGKSAAIDTTRISEYIKKNNIYEKSVFMTEKAEKIRIEYQKEYNPTISETLDATGKRISDTLDFAYTICDSFTSKIAFNAYFLKGIDEGMNANEAVRYADKSCRAIMATRLKGTTPIIYGNTKNPLLRWFTQFQRETMAQFEHMTKGNAIKYGELKKKHGAETAKRMIAKDVMSVSLSATFMNVIFDAIGVGSVAMFDVVGGICEMFGGTGELIQNLVNLVMAKASDDEEDDKEIEDAFNQFWKDFSGIDAFKTFAAYEAKNIPYADNVLALLGMFTGKDLGSGTTLNVPSFKNVSKAIKDVGEIGEAKEKMKRADSEENLEELQKLIEDENAQLKFHILETFFDIIAVTAPAGNQIRKTANGLLTVIQGGDYTDGFKQGRLNYQVSGGDIARAILFGKGGTHANQKWVNQNFESLSKTETEAYQTLVDSGVKPEKAFRTVKIAYGAEKIEKETEAQAKMRVIDNMPGISEKHKALLYRDMVATDSEKKAIDAAISAGNKEVDAVRASRAIRAETKMFAKMQQLMASELDEDGKWALYKNLIAQKAYDDNGKFIGLSDQDKIDAILSSGLDTEDYLNIKTNYTLLNADENLTASRKSTRFLAWTSKQGYTEQQQTVIDENFSFVSIVKDEHDTYNKMIKNGVTPDNAVIATDALHGKKSTSEKISALYDLNLNTAEYKAALKAVLQENAYERYMQLYGSGVGTQMYLWVLDNADTDGDKYISYAERLSAIRNLSLSREKSAILWEATGGGEKSNPFKTFSENKKLSTKVKIQKIEIPKIKLPKIGI